MDVLVFEVGGMRYALPAPQVREIVRAVTILSLPAGPSIVEGLVNVRGVLVPILDLRARFRLPSKPVAHTDHFILAWAGSRLVGIRADRAHTLVRADADTIEDLALLTRHTEYVAGVAKLPDGLVLIHDLVTFLDDGETAALESALRAAARDGAVT